MQIKLGKALFRLESLVMWSKVLLVSDPPAPSSSPPQTPFIQGLVSCSKPFFPGWPAFPCTGPLSPKQRPRL
jgi:hypothetical protein